MYQINPRYLKLCLVTVSSILVSYIYQPIVRAEGSVSLDDITSLVRQSKKLAQQFNAELQTSGQNVSCMGLRLGRQYGDLAGARVPPFDCTFANHKTLIIEADLLIRLPNGRIVELAPDSHLPEGSRVYYKLKSWNWEQSYSSNKPDNKAHCEKAGGMWESKHFYGTVSNCDVP